MMKLVPPNPKCAVCRGGGYFRDWSGGFAKCGCTMFVPKKTTNYVVKVEHSGPVTRQVDIYYYASSADTPVGAWWDVKSWLGRLGITWETEELELLEVLQPSEVPKGSRVRTRRRS